MLTVTNLCGFMAVGEAGESTEFEAEFIGATVDTTDLTTYTFNNVNIGTPHSTRLVVVGVVGGAGSSRSLSSGTIDGGAATVLVAAGASDWDPSGFMARAVPTGSQCTITVTFSGGVSRAGIYVWTVKNCDDAAGYSSQAKNEGASTSQTCVLDIPDNGAALYVHTHGNANAVGFSSASELDDTAVEASWRFAAAQKDVTSAIDGHTETISWSGSVGRGTSGVSFGPVTPGTAAPTVAATNSGNNNTAGTSHTCNLPASISAGDLLILSVSADNTTISTPSGWTQLCTDINGTGARLSVFYKVAGGSEGGTVSVSTGASTRSSHASYRITGYSGTPEAQTTNGSSTTPDPPSLTPSWGTFKTLWIVALASKTAIVFTSHTVSAYPTGYSNNQISALANWTVSTTTHNLRNTIANRVKAVSADNPSTFTISQSGTWSVATIAVQGV